jgi:hypothetical protein
MAHRTVEGVGMKVMGLAMQRCMRGKIFESMLEVRLCWFDDSMLAGRQQEMNALIDACLC